MKKIMFSDKYSLTQAVLDGRKTQTRRIITAPKKFKHQYVAGFHVYKRPYDGFISEICMYDEDERDFEEGQIRPKYKIGEIVAVAQSYKDVGFDIRQYKRSEDAGYGYLCGMGYDEIPMKLPVKGYTNKMFVKTKLMPHNIVIEKIRIQKLQDISDEDCLAEGVELNQRQFDYDGTKYYCVRGLRYWRGFGSTNYNTPREAYSVLIDKISGKGTWESNPYVFAYDFKLIK